MLKETDFVSLRPLVGAQLLTNGRNNLSSQFDLLGVDTWDGRWESTGYWDMPIDICKKVSGGIVANCRRDC